MVYQANEQLVRYCIEHRLVVQQRRTPCNAKPPAEILDLPATPPGSEPPRPRIARDA
jgi:hypothetical protein